MTTTFLNFWEDMTVEEAMALNEAAEELCAMEATACCDIM